LSGNWRYLGFSVNDAPTNMGIDEAVGRLKAKMASPDTIRFYRWKPSAVSIGYFQVAQEEVNLEACASMGISLVRRITGGGAVYHDYNGEVTYSVIADLDHTLIPLDIRKSYEFICRGIITALAELGIEAEFKPINDITVNGRKISGNAQTRRWGTILQHGTILLDSDIHTMFKVLRVSKEKISDKHIRAVEERVTTVRRELGRRVEFEEMVEALKKGFEETFETALIEAGLSVEEHRLVDDLRIRKYMSGEWNLRRPREHAHPL